MSEFVKVIKPGASRPLAPQAVVLMDPATGETVGSAAAPVPVAAASAAYSAQLSILRPANVTPYLAGDVVGGVLTFPNMGPAGGSILLNGVTLRLDIALLPAGMSSFRLYLYSATPPSALADNAPWVSHSAGVVTADRALLVSYVDLSMPLLLGGTGFVQVDGLSKQLQLGDGETALYGYLVTTGGYTPAANSEVYELCLQAVAL